MNYLQAITPNPDIPCKPGWCLAYVNQAFGPLPIRYGRAIDAWNASATQHRDMMFPENVWVPVWFSLENEPAGHVALRAPDGSIYSTSDPYGYTPHHHPSMADLLQTYARNNPLTYLGWTEDVEGTPVITLEDTLSAADAQNIIDSVQAMFNHAVDERLLKEMPGRVWSEPIDYRNPVTGELVPKGTTPETVLSYVDTNTAKLLTSENILSSIPDNLAQQVLDGLVERLKK